MKKTIPVFLISLLLFQSCYIYQKTPVSITEATNNGRVKMINKSAKEYELREIRIENEEFYGNYKGKLILIDNLAEKQYYLLDTRASRSKTAIGIVAAILIPVGVILIFATIDFAVNGL